MAFTLVAFHDAEAHSSLAAVDAVADPHVRVSGNDIYVPKWNLLLAVFAGGDNMSECRLQSPSLRRLAQQRIAPVCDEALPLTRGSWTVDEGGTSTHNIVTRDVDPNPFFHDFKDNPRVLDVSEALNAYAVNGDATDEWILVWLGDGIEAVPSGEMFTVEATLSVTGSKGNWVNGAITFAQTLSAGRYAIVGMRAQASNAVAARLVFQEYPHRPGVLCVAGDGYPDIKTLRYGGFGVFGEFEHDTPPTVDVLANADATVNMELNFDLIQVRAGAA